MSKLKIYIYTGLFLMVIIVLLNYSNVFAADPRPVASSVSIDSGAASITLTEGSTKNTIITTTVTDDNGCIDITGVTVKFFKTSTGADASDDENNHYTVTTPTDVVQNTCVGNVATYTATIPVWYYADPAEWTAQVIPSDGADGTASTDIITVDTLVALDVSTTIAYGALSLGANTGTTDQTTTVTNTGNVNIGTQVNGYSGSSHNIVTTNSMTCTIGSISVENEKFSPTALTAYASRSDLTGTATTVDSFTVNQRTGAVSSGILYWGFGLPVNGVGGNCAGTVVFTAIP